ncbi:MAG: lytic transglycosylase domain-containing protein [Blastocatellia bacterium]
MRKRLLTLLALLLVSAAGLFVGRHYWTHRYDKLIKVAARQHSLDPALVKAIVYEESFFSPGAHSSQNAVGLMQITPVVAQEWVEAKRAHSLSEAVAPISSKPPARSEEDFETTFRDPAVSLHVGCWYLQSLFNRYRDEPDPLAFALAAYNAGPSNVERWAPGTDRLKVSRDEFISRIDFPVTRSYVQKIIQRYDDYKRSSELAD